MYYLRTRPKADAIQFTVNQEMLAESTSKPAQDQLERNPSPTSVTAAGKVSVNSKFAGLQMKDEEEECLNCGA